MIAGTAVLLALAVACGGAGDQESVRGLGPDRFVREVTKSERATLAQAKKVLTARCMGDRGFHYVVPPPEPEIAQRDFPYVMDDPVWAKKHGYGSDLEELIKQKRRRDPVAHHFHGLPAERQAAAKRALNGDRPVGVSVDIPGLGTFTRNPDSCGSRADRELYGDLATWFRVEIIATNLRFLYATQVRADLRYKTAVRAWSECMNRRGVRAADPEALGAALARASVNLPDVQARRLEVRYATTEAECALKSPLAATARRLDRDYKNSTYNRFHREMQIWNHLQLKALPSAERILQNAK